ncbi:Sugar phosphate isomerase/epimerase [Microlunatus soli]|uniref:Sugar phosphate isomerase/epimerase n=2 Tax=Microlunatus soli TaxID=630515 RepID=A0A1H1XEP7_9ACTN|nr:Sugar phosphate isomerase/epimerase [Microlunatus soli]
MRALPGTSFEVMFYNGWSERADEVLRTLIATGARMPVLHAAKSIGPALVTESADERWRASELFDLNCRFAHAIGAELVVLHLWGLPDSDARIDQQLAVLPRLADIADDHGVQLSIETLLCREQTPVDVVARCVAADPRVGITADTAFLAMHDQLEQVVADQRLWTTGGVDHVHLKDLVDPHLPWGQGQQYLHPDEGKLDLQGFLAGLRSRGYAGRVTLEAQALRPDDSPDVDRIRSSLAWISRAMSGDDDCIGT